MTEEEKRCAREGVDDARDDARSMDVSVSRNGIAMECVATTDDWRRRDED